MQLIEGELSFDFPGCQCEHFDEANKYYPLGWCKVDFLVDEASGRRLLIEVKDPSEAPLARRKAAFTDKAEVEGFVHNKLVRSCRDSCMVLMLLGRNDRLPIFVAFLGDDQIAHDNALYLLANERLKSLIQQEMKTPWTNGYVGKAVLVGFRDWQKYFPNYSVTRQ